MQRLFLPPTTYHLPPTNRGQATLSLVFIIGGVVLLVGTTLAFLALTMLNASFGFQAANRALAVAHGGVDDALLQIVRNKDFSAGSPGYCVPAENTPCPSAYATVIVTQNSPEAGKATITSEATILRYKRKIQAVASIASSTGEVELLTLEPVAL